MTNTSTMKTRTSLQQRIVTALAIGAVVLGCIFFGNFTTAALFAAIGILGALEISDIISVDNYRTNRIIHMVGAMLPLFALKYLSISTLYPMFVGVSCTVMLALIINLWRPKKIKYPKYSYFFTVFYWGLPLSLGSTFMMNQGENSYLTVLGIILLLWTSDSMAYFTGKRFGKNKLFPSVSPGKTVEGSLGAGFFSLVISVIYAMIIGQSYLLWIVIALIVWVFGTLGDLVESKLKRTQNVKDSGTLLPGHGGFLDRFDSLVMIIPFLLALHLFFLG